VPGYLAKQDALAAAGVDEVLVVCINDAAVMEAWAADQGCLDNAKRRSLKFVDSDRADGLVTFAADTHGALTEGLGMVMEPIKNLGGMRSLRYAAVFDNGFATHVAVSGLPGVDAAGDAFYANSCVDAILDVLAESPGAS